MCQQLLLVFIDQGEEGAAVGCQSVLKKGGQNSNGNCHEVYHFVIACSKTPNNTWTKSPF
jgi:hypothetical protein